MAKTFRINDIEEKYVQKIWKEINDTKHRIGEKMITDTKLIHEILEKALRISYVTEEGEIAFKSQSEKK